MKYRLFIGSYTNYRKNRKYRSSGMPEPELLNNVHSYGAIAKARKEVVLDTTIQAAWNSIIEVKGQKQTAR